MNNTDIAIIIITFIVFLLTVIKTVCAIKKKDNRFKGKHYTEIKQMLGKEQEEASAGKNTLRIWKNDGYELELVFDENDMFLYIRCERIF